MQNRATKEQRLVKTMAAFFKAREVVYFLEKYTIIASHT